VQNSEQVKKSGFVAVVGRPSAGKSTLINRLCGQKVSIVSAVPQTTRNAIRGIVNSDAGQLVFVDTPGRYKSEKKGNRKLLEVSDQAVKDADCILYLIDASRSPGAEEEDIAALLAPYSGRLVAAVNKTDLPLADVAGARAFVAGHFPGLAGGLCFEVSAKDGSGTDGLLDGLFSLVPDGEPFYGKDVYTDQEVDFRIAEVIREQAINRLQEEIPHSLYVDVADAQLTDAPQNSKSSGKLWVRAFIIVERESQKGIVVGKGGSMIKEIRLAAIKELRGIFDWKIELDLRVKQGSGK